MSARPAQIELSRQILDTMLDGRIALFDAGTGIGKTYACLVAGSAFDRCRAAGGLGFQSILFSTSSIVLQNEYLPFLLDVLIEDRFIDRPIRTVIRKGKSHYVCEERLHKRLKKADLKKKNRKTVDAIPADIVVFCIAAIQNASCFTFAITTCCWRTRYNMEVGVDRFSLGAPLL